MRFSQAGERFPNATRRRRSRRFSSTCGLSAARTRTSSGWEPRPSRGTAPCIAPSRRQADPADTRRPARSGRPLPAIPCAAVGRLRPAASRLIAFAETTWGAVTVFGIALAVWWIQAIAIPVGPGRDFETYVGDFVELFQRHPIDIGYVLGRTPIAPLVTGALLDFAHGALAEPGMSILYALSVTAWFLAARRFGAGAAVASTVVLLAYPSYGILFHDLASDS